MTILALTRHPLLTLPPITARHRGYRQPSNLHPKGSSRLHLQTCRRPTARRRQPGSREVKDQRVLLAPQDLQVLRVGMARMESREVKDQRDLQVLRVGMARMESRAGTVEMALTAGRVSRGHRASQFKGRPVNREGMA